MARSPPTHLGFLADECYGREALGFVHVATARDPTMQYLTRVDGPRERFAFVFVDGGAHLIPPPGWEDAAGQQFVGDAVVDLDSLDGATPGTRAASLLSARGAETGLVLVPRHIPHDAALYLEQAGFELASTDAVDREREEKIPAEVDRVRRVQRGAERALAAAAETLAAADADGTALSTDDGTLTTERLRRVVDAALASDGLDPAGNTVVAAGNAAARFRFRGDVPIRAGEPVVVDVTPRGPFGYHTDFARTFVVDTDGGWDRRAHVAVEQALDAGLDAMGPGVEVARVQETVAGEIRSFGFPTDRTRDVGFFHDAVHGIGLARREPPRLSTGDTFEPGHVVALEAGVYDPTEGGLRLEDPVLVTEDGAEVLAEFPRTLRPGSD